MTTKLAKPSRITQFNRSGSVHYRLNQSEDGWSSVALTVDYERVPVPDHTYVADFVEVSRIESEVLIVFGKVDLPSGSSLRNKIEIYFPADSFVGQLWKSSRKLHETLAKSVAAKGFAAKAPSQVSTQTERVQTLITNNALIVLVGGQCLMDFFLISAKDLWIKTRKGEPLNTDALVRVYLNESLLLQFLNRCDELAQELIRDLNILLPEDNDENVESVEL